MDEFISRSSFGTFGSPKRRRITTGQTPKGVFSSSQIEQESKGGSRNVTTTPSTISGGTIRNSQNNPFHNYPFSSIFSVNRNDSSDDKYRESPVVFSDHKMAQNSQKSNSGYSPQRMLHPTAPALQTNLDAYRKDVVTNSVFSWAPEELIKKFIDETPTNGTSRLDGNIPEKTVPNFVELVPEDNMGMATNFSKLGLQLASELLVESVEGRKLFDKLIALGPNVQNLFESKTLGLRPYNISQSDTGPASLNESTFRASLYHSIFRCPTSPHLEIEQVNDPGHPARLSTSNERSVFTVRYIETPRAGVSQGGVCRTEDPSILGRSSSLDQMIEKTSSENKSDHNIEDCEMMEADDQRLNCGEDGSQTFERESEVANDRVRLYIVY